MNGDEARGSIHGNALTQDEITHYVALDLGSESMAAFYEHRDAPPGRSVSLQECATAYLQDAVGADLLMTNGRPSNRLRTRIILREPRQTQDLPNDHATVVFIEEEGKYNKDADRSLFRFFQKKDEGGQVMPNPKLVFQTGCRMAVPELSLVGSSQMRIPPIVISPSTPS